MPPDEDRASELACLTWDEDRDAAITVLMQMVDIYGYEAVSRWLRNIGIQIGATR